MIEIIKNTMVEPIQMTCEDCSSIFTYNYEDIQSERDTNLFGQAFYSRYIVCPVCKCRNYIKSIRAKDKEGK